VSPVAEPMAPGCANQRFAGCVLYQRTICGTTCLLKIIDITGSVATTSSTRRVRKQRASRTPTGTHWFRNRKIQSLSATEPTAPGCANQRFAGCVLFQRTVCGTTCLLKMIVITGSVATTSSTRRVRKQRASRAQTGTPWGSASVN
jgi:hypothetical protein